MPDGRLKIGSDFLKIGALYLRIGPEGGGADPYADNLIAVLDDGTVWALQVGAGAWVSVGTHGGLQADVGWYAKHVGKNDHLFFMDDDLDLFHSTDGGVTYSTVSPAPGEVFHFGFDGTNLWVLDVNGDVYKSTNFGSSYTLSLAAGLDFVAGAVAIHPNDPDVVCVLGIGPSSNVQSYSTTNGGGGWTGPVDVWAAPREPWFFGNAVYGVVTRNGIFYAYESQQIGTAGADHRVMGRYSDDNGATWNATGISYADASTTGAGGSDMPTRALERTRLGAIGHRDNNLDTLNDDNLGSSTSFGKPGSGVCIGSAYNDRSDTLYLLYDSGECWKIESPPLTSRITTQLATLGGTNDQGASIMALKAGLPGVEILAGGVDHQAHPLNPFSLFPGGQLSDYDSTPDMWILAVFVDTGAISSVAFFGAETGSITLIDQGGGYLFYEVLVTAYDAGAVNIQIDSVGAGSISASIFAVFGGLTVVQVGTPAFVDPFVNNGNTGIQVYAGQEPVADPANGWRQDAGEGMRANSTGMTDTTGGGSFSPPGGQFWVTTHKGQPSGTANAAGLALEIGP